jgi:hypothetical protein
LENPLLGFLLALASIAVPLGLAGLLVELRARKESPFENSRKTSAAEVATAISSKPIQSDIGT